MFQLLGRLGTLMLTLVMCRRSNQLVCYQLSLAPGLTIPPCFLSRSKAVTPAIGAVEVLGAFYLAAGPHV